MGMKNSTTTKERVTNCSRCRRRIRKTEPCGHCFAADVDAAVQAGLLKRDEHGHIVPTQTVLCALGNCRLGPADIWRLAQAQAMIDGVRLLYSEGYMPAEFGVRSAR